MKRLLNLTLLSLLALSSSAFAGKGNPHKPENQTNKPKPIVRDHRTPNVAPVVRDHRTPNQPPKLVNSGQSNMSGGGYVNNNGIVQRAPAVNNKPLTNSISQPMSSQTPPRDPRPLSSQLLVSPGAKDQRFTPVTNSGAVVRDHRDQTGYGQYSYPGRPNVSNMSGGVMVTNTNVKPSKQGPKPLDTKVTVAPDLSVRGPAPIVRDHRTMTSQNLVGPTVRDHRSPVAGVPAGSVGNFNWPSINQNASPVVRDHRGTSGNGQGGVTVTNSPGSRDNTIYGTGPGLHTVVDAAGNGLTSVGNAFGIGYGSVTSGAPTRPQVVDHRNR